MFIVVYVTGKVQNQNYSKQYHMRRADLIEPMYISDMKKDGMPNLKKVSVYWRCTIEVRAHTYYVLSASAVFQINKKN